MKPTQGCIRFRTVLISSLTDLPSTHVTVVFLANSALKLQIPRRFCHRPKLSNASYRPRSCDKIMRGKIILICQKVVSYDFTLHDFVTVYFQNENCWSFLPESELGDCYPQISQIYTDYGTKHGSSPFQGLLRNLRKSVHSADQRSSYWFTDRFSPPTGISLRVSPCPPKPPAKEGRPSWTFRLAAP